MKTHCAALLLLASCLAVVAARSGYQLPYGVELLRTQVINSFSCAGRPYGYYADVANDCTIFHVCYPVTDGEGILIEEAHFSFMCGNLTVFSQDTLTCTLPEEAYPCDQSESLYDLSNADFGRIPEDDLPNADFRRIPEDDLSNADLGLISEASENLIEDV